MKKIILLGAFLLSLVPTAFASEYDRGEWFTGWRDPDRNCLNTREEVLIFWSDPNELVLGVDKRGRPNCTVEAGLWIDPFSNMKYTDPKELDIDHIVALKEANRSLTKEWTVEQKRAFGQNQMNLIPVHKSLNRQKQDKDPTQWMPPANQCDYLRRWIFVKFIYKLKMDDKEQNAIQILSHKHCPNQ